jgi:hypothetical protein
MAFFFQLLWRMVAIGGFGGDWECIYGLMLVCVVF